MPVLGLEYAAIYDRMLSVFAGGLRYGEQVTMTPKNPDDNYVEGKPGQGPAIEHVEESQPALHPASLNSAPPSTGQPESDPKRRDWFDKLKTGLEVIGLIVLITYTAFAALQWSALLDSNRIGRQSADAATSAAKTAIDALISSERPWVGPNGPVSISVKSLTNSKFDGIIYVPIRNFGKAPAFNVMVDAEMVVADLDKRAERICDLVAPFIGIKPVGVVGVSDERVYKRRWGQMQFPDANFVANIGYGSPDDAMGKVAYVIGCVVYQDLRANRHWTRFCYETAQAVRDLSSFVATGVRGYQFHRNHRCPGPHRWPPRQHLAWHLRVSLEGLLHSGAEAGLVLQPSGEGR